MTLAAQRFEQAKGVWLLAEALEQRMLRKLGFRPYLWTTAWRKIVG